MRALISALMVLTALAGAPPRAPVAGPEEEPKFVPAEVVSTAPAVYPAKTVVGGTVVLQVTVGESGAIEAVRILHSIPPLTDEAERSVRKWKFKPARLEGEPVRSTVTVAFTFVPPVLQVSAP